MNKTPKLQHGKDHHSPLQTLIKNRLRLKI